MSYVLKHTGYIIPEIYQEPYKQKPFPVTLRATSIGNLKNIKYLDSNQDFITGTATLMEVITTCLNKLDYQIDIWDSVNTWEENMNVNVSPLTQAEIDQEAFIVEKDGRLQAKSCYEVLEQVLKPFVVNFFMDVGHWVIVPIELRGKSRTVRVFDYTGTLQSSSMKDPTETFDRTPADGNYCWVFSDQTLIPRSQLRDVQISHRHGEIENFIENGSLNEYELEGNVGDRLIYPTGWEVSDEADFETTFPNETLNNVPVPSANGGPLGLLFRDEFADPSAYVRWIDTDTYEFNENDEIRFEITYACEVLGDSSHSVDIPIRVRIGSYYLTSSGSWTTTPTDIVINDLGDSDISSILRYATKFRDFGIQSSAIQENGDLEFRISVPSDADGSNNVQVVYATVKMIYFPDGNEQQAQTVYFGNREIEVYSDDVTYDLISADGPTNFFDGSFLMSNGLSTNTWIRNDLDGSLIVIAIQQIFREYSDVSRVITGSQRSSNLFDRYFTEYDHTYTVNSGSYDERMCFFNGELMEVLDGDLSVTVYKVEQDGTLTQVDPIYS